MKTTPTPFEELLIIEEIACRVWEQAVDTPFESAPIIVWLELRRVLESRILVVSPVHIRLATRNGALIRH